MTRLLAWLVAGLLPTLAAAKSCSNDDECGFEADGKTCIRGSCGCRSDSDCGTWGNDFCQISSNTCKQCLEDSDCVSGKTCRDTSIGDKACQDSCTTDSDCQKGSDKNYKCTNQYCVHGMSGCDWKDEDSDEVGKKLIAGNIVGIVVALINVVVISLPLCCGIMKNAKAGPCDMPRLIAGVCIFVGIFVCFIPLMGTSSATEGAIDDLCDGHGCTCSEENKESFRGIVGAISFIIAYFYAFGWVAVVLGIAASIMGCCACCKCCGPLKDQPTGGAPVQGNVVGRPVA